MPFPFPHVRTEEVSISDASDTYVKVDIEEGMCEDELLSVWMVFDVTSEVCVCVSVCVCVHVCLRIACPHLPLRIHSLT